VVYPAQRSDANPSKCWNWLRTADQRLDKGEPSPIAGITRQVMQEYSVDPKRVLVMRVFSHRHLTAFKKGIKIFAKLNTP
jgi:Esterase PHB depolymerase